MQPTGVNTGLDFDFICKNKKNINKKDSIVEGALQRG